jgi:hypothetical protein
MFDAISFTPQARRVWSGFVGGLAAGAVIGGGYYGGGYYGGPYAYDGGCYIQRQFLSTALATASYDECEYAIELRS